MVALLATSYGLQATATGGSAAVDPLRQYGRPVRVCHLQAYPRTVTELDRHRHC